MSAPFTGNGDGAGGGGAGGAVYVHSDEIESCMHVSASGGAGGDSMEGAGGGGGGRIVAPFLPCPALVENGPPGTGAHAAEPDGGASGAILTLSAGGF